eukprot:TRINITY_DN89817_c0_g1_i1.p1 TRINITY_DN89817_c0_g1~~TRINITY_DN89817_c0_g1_i1.p1  ORF type:complete len:260 (+),score=61.79 TRINITY_DN89817_c0_g1_i1:97-876(+)
MRDQTGSLVGAVSSPDGYRERLQQRGLAALQQCSDRRPLCEKANLENANQAFMAAWVPLPVPAGAAGLSKSFSAHPGGDWVQLADNKRSPCEACFRSQHACAEAKVAQARSLQEVSDATGAAKAAQAAAEAAKAAMETMRAELRSSQTRAASAEACCAALTTRLEAAESARSHLVWGSGTEQSEKPKEEGMEGSTRRFVRATKDIASLGGGYLQASKNDELVALHHKDEWYWGFHLLNPKSDGWFLQSLVQVHSPTPKD